MIHKPVKIKIESQGVPVVKHGHVREKSGKMIALEIDLEQKYCDCSGVSGGDNEAPGIYIDASKRAKSTFITLPEYVDWDVFTAGTSKYTLKICLIKKS